MKYANLSMEKRYQIEGNLGDYNQFIAIDNIYKIMGIPEEEIVRIEYWDLIDYDGEDVILPINFVYLNPSKDSKPFVLSPHIHPVYLGLHLPGEVSSEEINYFTNNTPIGCRDQSTLEILEQTKKFSVENNDIYLQGCITATLPKRKDGLYEKIYIVDIPEFVRNKMPKKIKENATILSQLLYDKLPMIMKNNNCETVQEYALQRLSLYRDTAKLVITSRMHCAVPCLAMGIPVVFIVPVMSSRFTWLEKLIHIYTYDEIDKIDWNPKPIDFEEQKQWIVQLAINRIRGGGDHSLCYKIHNWYMDRAKREIISGNGLELLYNYAQLNWDIKENINYLLWGVTAISEDVYNWISNNYPQARLVAVIDEYRDIDFHGIHSIRSSNLINFKDCYYIGTGASASIAMKKLLLGLGEDWYARGIPIIP